MSHVEEVQTILKGRFDRQLNTKLIDIRGVDCIEQYNVNYITDYDEKFVAKKINSASKEDKIEREKFIKEVKKGAEKYVKEDLYTRQFVIQMKYDDKLELASCLSLMQFIVRDKKIDLHIFSRSQNFDSNFLYDNQTYMKLLRVAYDEICKEWGWMEIVIGIIYIHITSLHILK